jgi:hypothetical protein
MRHPLLGRRSGRFAAWSITVLLVALAGCSKSPETITGPSGDTVAPTVSATNPLNGAVGVVVITASFSEAMNASTITTATFEMSGPGAAPIAGTITYDASTYMARFAPSGALAPGTAYTATITTGAQDAAGNALAIDHAWRFTTSAPVSTRPPSRPPLPGGA